MQKKKVSIISIVLLTGAFVFAFLAVKEYLPYWKNDISMRIIQRQITGKEDTGKDKKRKNINWKKLNKMNPDIIAWIEVPGTKIDYPLLKCPTDSYYLHKDLKKKDNILGSIFVQTDTSRDFSDKHTVVYGHNMKDQQMFGSLHQFESRKFWKKHQDLYIYQPEQTIHAIAYSTYDCTDATDTYKTEFTTEKEWGEWLSMTAERSYYDTGITPEVSGQVITLSTCSNRRARTSRYVVNCVVEEVLNE